LEEEEKEEGGVIALNNYGGERGLCFERKEVRLTWHAENTHFP
jgi:hypothetical protein